MTRIKLDFPQNKAFSTEIPIRISDLNYADHLGNDAVLALAHEARVRFFRSHGWTELNIDGVGIVMANAAIVFKSEGFYGDVVLIEIAVSDLGILDCDLHYRLTNKKTGNEIALIKTGIVFFDYDKRKPVPMPEVFRSTFR